MNILAVGDIVGNSGVNKLKSELKDIKAKYNIDFCIVNGENSAEGMGITKKNFDDIILAGADCITMGNHTWGKKEIFTFIDDPKILQTADEQILPKGTAYITDIGMTGPKNSVLGMDKEAALKRFLTALPEKYRVATGETMLNGCVFKINDETNTVMDIERITR